MAAVLVLSEAITLDVTSAVLVGATTAAVLSSLEAFTLTLEVVSAGVVVGILVVVAMVAVNIYTYACK